MIAASMIESRAGAVCSASTVQVANKGHKIMVPWKTRERWRCLALVAMDPVPNGGPMCTILETLKVAE